MNKKKLYIKIKKGFSLIEMLVVVVIVGSLIALSLSSFTTWINDAQVRSVAEALQNGLRTAQAEASSRSQETQFILTNSATLSASATPAQNGNRWVIVTVPMFHTSGSTLESSTFIQGADLVGTTQNVAVNGPNPASSGTITFNAVGKLVGATSNVCYAISSPESDRNLKVTVSIGGQVRLCDPNKSITTASDGCPASVGC